MKISNKVWSVLLVFSMVTCLAVGYSFSNGLLSHVSPKVTVNMSYEFELADGAGASGSIGNQITDIGDQYVSNITVGRTMTDYTYGTNGTVYIALGNGSSLAYADTQLTTEVAGTDTGFRRCAALTPTYATGTGIGNGYHFNFTVTNKFTASVADTINCTSLQWSGGYVTNNNMFAEASIGTLPVGQAFAINDNCTITWTITFQH
ncbi:hypothetical protein MUP79_01305 [Candidatus Bathyarchaeota archaeon]|nr:hypothetical protein [Candidatus Bathyarchaeota archaeon]